MGGGDARTTNEITERGMGATRKTWRRAEIIPLETCQCSGVPNSGRTMEKRLVKTQVGG